MLHGENPRLGFDVLYTFTDQGGSMTWGGEPRFHDAERIVSLSKSQDPEIQYLTISKLIHLGKYTGAKGAPLVNNKSIQKQMLSIAKDKSKGIGIRGLAAYWLATTLPNPKENLQAVAELLFPALGEATGLHGLPDHFGLWNSSRNFRLSWVLKEKHGYPLPDPQISEDFYMPLLRLLRFAGKPWRKLKRIAPVKISPSRRGRALRRSGNQVERFIFC